MAAQGTGFDVDVVVVGGGGGGLTAASSAALQGASVALFEKEPACGGNTARSIGSIPGAGSQMQADAGVDDSPQRFVDDVAQHIGGAFNERGVTRLAETSAELVEWLGTDLGIPLRLTEDYRHVGHSVARLHNPPRREGAVLIEHLATFAERRGVAIRTRAPVQSIARGDDGGFQVHVAGEVIRARAIILATDGFGANSQMMREQCARYAGLSYLGGPGNVGDGIRMGTELGGVTDSMSAVLGFAIMGVPDDCPSSWDTMVSWTVIENGGIVVDGSGRRFADESVGYSAFVDDVIDHGESNVYAVFDERILQSVALWEERFRLLVERADSPVRRIDPPDPPFDLSADALSATVSQYAAAASGARRDPHGRQDFGWAPLGAPLYAARAEPSVLTTLGGLVVGDNGEVHDADGAPIDGLFAVGGTAQTLTGTAGARGYISGAGLLAALGYGRLAGAAAAAWSRAAKPSV
jgi:fumarate reductase flavoprotein subunit